MNCRVVVEAAVPVYDVETPDEAVRIAISKTGEMLNPDLNYVEINMGSRSCPHCEEDLEPAFIAADESLVALKLEMTVFNVEREEHASRIARKEIGQRMENIPLDVLEIEVIEEDDDEEESNGEETVTDDSQEGTAGDTDRGDTDGSSGESVDDQELAEDSGVGEDQGGSEEPGEEDVLPEFEELMEE